MTRTAGGEGGPGARYKGRLEVPFMPEVEKRLGSSDGLSQVEATRRRA